MMKYWTQYKPIPKSEEVFELGHENEDLDTAKAELYVMLLQHDFLRGKMKRKFYQVKLACKHRELI